MFSDDIKANQPLPLQCHFQKNTERTNDKPSSEIE